MGPGDYGIFKDWSAIDKSQDKCICIRDGLVLEGEVQEMNDEENFYDEGPYKERIRGFFERICPSRGSISQIRSRFGVGVRSFSWNWSVRNGGVLGESSTDFREASRRLSTGREWDWHVPDAC